jgi:hypothetical protein
MKFSQPEVIVANYKVVGVHDKEPYDVKKKELLT